ncbi:hypothetical protein AC244_13975 [Ensifer adhaerens]|uniref:Uncharacterized protein n=1 Tax=Ensifer adhaerens TaxID=106592 RepID=A0A0L8BUR6_ENSAD|nr:hypothetical protein AC244_13975 [Ensifer adhaerens]
MTRARVVSSIATDSADLLVFRDLGEKLRQHRRIAGSVVADLDGPDVKRISVNTKMQLAPLPAIGGAMLAALPFSFAHHFDAGAVDEEMECAAAGAVRDFHVEHLLAPTQGRVIGNGPIQAGKGQQAGDKADRLAKRKAKQHLEGQAGLKGRL